MTVCGRTARDSIELRPDGGDPIVVPGPVHTDPAGSTGPVDVLVLAVKATQNDDAAGWLARLCDERTIVTVLQNGVEQVEQVQAPLPVVAGDPGDRVVLGRDPTAGLGAAAHGSRAGAAQRARGETVAELLRGAGCRVDCDPDFITASWRKLLTNALAGFMALSGRRSGMFRRDDIADLSRRYVAECLAVARAEGARLPDSVVDEMADIFRHAPEDMGTSILTDRENQPADGVGHPQRGDHPQGTRPRAGDADQRRGGAAAGGGRRRPRLGCSHTPRVCESLCVTFNEGMQIDTSTASSSGGGGGRIALGGGLGGLLIVVVAMFLGRRSRPHRQSAAVEL